MKPLLKSSKCIRYLAWLGVLLTILYLIFFIYRYTCYQHPDTGWQLYSAWAVATGGGRYIDFLMSYRPAFLLNVPLIWLFGINLWAMRCYMMLLAAASIAWMVVAINPSHRRSVILPFAIIAYLFSILFFTDYVMSYYTAIPIGLIAGLAAFHHAQRVAKPTPYLIFGGLLITLTMLMNIAMIPAGMISIVVLASLLKTHRRWFITSSLITLIIAVSGYLYGFDLLHRWLQAAHNLHWLHKATPGIIHQLSNQLLLGLLFFILSGFPGLLGWAVGRFVVQHYTLKQILSGSILISIILLAVIIIQGHIYQHISTYPYEYVVAGGFFLGLLWALLRHDTNATSIYQAALISGLMIVFYFNHRATSENMVGSIFSLYYPVLLLYLSALFWHQIKPVTRGITLWILLLFTIAIPTLINLYPANLYQHPRPIWHNTAQGPYHTKIPTYTAALYQRFMQLYTSHHCQHVFFFSYFDTPMGYVLAQRYAPFNQSWVSHVNFNPINGSLNQHALISQFNQTNQWCVLYSSTSDQTLATNSHYLVDILTYLELYSDDVQIIGFNPATNQYYWLYTKTSR